MACTPAQLAAAKRYKERHKAKVMDYARSWRDNNREAIREYNRRRYAEDPERQRFWARQWRENNLEQARAKSRAWQQANPARVYANHIKYRANHNGKFTEEEWQEVLNMYDHCCAHCGKSDKEVKLTRDHIMPLSKGGKNVKSNIQPLCQSCNSRKNNKVMDFRPTLEAV